MKKIFTILITFLLANGTVGFAGEAPDVRQDDAGLAKPAVTSDVWLDANRMNGIFRNNGVWFHDVMASNWGLEWPKGSGLSPIFGGGQYVGARVDGDIRVAGVQHDATEFQPGEILPSGEAANPRAGEYRWYTLQPGGEGDWTNWPVDQGAPVTSDGRPELIGDQTIFSVWNDLAQHTEYTTGKLSVEVRQTAWAFNRADALGDMIFIKWQLVNKSGSDYDSTYFVIWQDPDVGEATDDLVGSDSTLGLGYAYNATNNDKTYGAAPPAVGIDFFQGPIIDKAGSTVSLPDGTTLHDKKMLNMTSFIFYNNDDSPQGNPHTGQDVWNYMRGFWRDGSPIVNDGANGTTTGPKTKFMFSGDPETGSGWLDSNAADRRFFMTTGPFPMKAWEDTDGDGQAEFGEPGVQEIVAGVIVARGDNNLHSVTKLKEVDKLAQLAYDLNFVLAKSPTPPEVEVSERPNKVILTWNENSEFMRDGSPYESTDPIVAQAYGDTVIMNNVEKVIDDSTYNFYGYTVWQYSDASGRDPVKVEQFNINETKNAQPYTKQRFIELTENKNPAVGNVGNPLINGKQYYFGIQATGYLEYGAPQYFESAPTIVTVLPHGDPGTRVTASEQDTVFATHTLVDTTAPGGDGQAYAVVIDPSQLTGHTYEVNFNADDTWNLIDVTEGDTVLKNQTNQQDNNAYNVVDGMMVKVTGPAPGIKQVIEVDPAGAMVDNGVSIVDWSLGSTGYIISNRASSDAHAPVFNQPPYTSDFDRFGYWGKDEIEIDFTEESVAWQYLTDVTLEEKVPFALYRHDFETGEKERLFVAIYDEGLVDSTAAQGVGVWDTTGVDGIFGSPAYEYVYGYVSADGPYDPANESEYLSVDNITEPPSNTGWGDDGNPLVYPLVTAIQFVDYGGNGLPLGNRIIFRTNKPNSSNDVFNFTAPSAPVSSDSLLSVDLDRINVVPNPYYGYHSGEMNIFNRWVQFTNLPEKCTVRIFDLAGNQIRRLEKNDPENTFLKWDLKNEYELPVASGIYVFHVEVPGVGNKVGKVAIMTPEERLDTY